MDRESAALANALVCKSAHARVWELSLFGGQFLCDRAGSVAVVGATCQVALDGELFSGNLAFALREGQSMSVSGEPGGGARVYVAFGEGASRSRVRLAEPPSSLELGPIHLLPGPQSPLLPARFLGAAPWVVGHESDRVGWRLRSHEQALVHTHELPSEPACVGAVQWTPDGTLLIVGPDGPTLGGYPKVAVVAECDLDRVGQLEPGASVDFQFTEPEHAKSLRQARVGRIERRLNELGLRREATWS